MAVYACRASGAARGGERGEVLVPFLIVWAHFRYEASSTATFHCQYLIKVNIYRLHRVIAAFARANFRPQSSQPRLESDRPGHERSP